MSASTEARTRPRVDRRLLVAAALWLALGTGYLVMSVFAAYRDYFPADLRIEHWLQAQDRPTVGGILSVPNFMGDGIGAIGSLVVILLATLALRRYAATVAFLAVAAPRLVEVVTKSLVERPRPSPDLVHVTENASGWSYPSGHVIGIVAIFGLLLLLAPWLIGNRPLRWLVQAFAAFLVLAVGPARVYVGAHWPSDVLGSYVLGVLFLVPAVWACRTFLPEWLAVAQERVVAVVRPQRL